MTNKCIADRLKKMGGPGRSLPGGPSGPRGEINLRAFWEAFPFEEPNFYSREVRLGNFPGAAGVQQVDNFVVPPHQVIIFTDIRFRTYALAAGGGGVGQETWLRDDFWYGTGGFTYLTWNITIGGSCIQNRVYNSPTNGIVHSRYVKLNQNILVPRINSFIVAKEGEEVTVDAWVQAAAVAIAVGTDLAVEYKGVQTTMAEYDRLVREFGG